MFYSRIEDLATTNKVIYTITIENDGVIENVYVGKASSKNRPLKTYEKCTNNFENNVHRSTYRNGEVVGSRPHWRAKVHPVLSAARAAGKNINLSMVNVIGDIDVQEKAAIREAVATYGVEKMLNSQEIN